MKKLVIRIIQYYTILLTELRALLATAEASLRRSDIAGRPHWGREFALRNPGSLPP